MNWTAAKKVRAGDRVFFEYQCTPSENSAHTELWHHTCLWATVKRRIKSSEIDEAEVGPMFVLQFDDGFEFAVMADEIHRKRQYDCKPWQPRRSC